MAWRRATHLLVEWSVRVLVLAAWVACVFPAPVACRNLVLACSIIRAHPTR